MTPLVAASVEATLRSRWLALRVAERTITRCIAQFAGDRPASTEYERVFMQSDEYDECETYEMSVAHRMRYFGAMKRAHARRRRERREQREREVTGTRTAAA